MFLRGIREIETALTHSITEAFTKTEQKAAQATQSVSNALALSLPKIPVVETGFDQVGVVGKPSRLSAKFEMNLPGPFNPDQSGKNVEFYINGRLVGTSKTDSEGQAAIDYTPTQNGRYDFTYRIADSRYSDPQGKATLYVDPPRPTLVFDIDGTLSNM